MSNRRNTFSTCSTRPPGRSSFRSPPCRLRETYVAIKMLTAELSSWDRFRTFNNSWRTPLATNSCRWPLNRSLSPPLMVDLPRRSNMVTSPDSRIDISRPIESSMRHGGGRYFTGGQHAQVNEPIARLSSFSCCCNVVRACISYSRCDQTLVGFGLIRRFFVFTAGSAAVSLGRRDCKLASCRE